MKICPGSVYWTEFPYSDLSQKKARPVLALKALEHGDVIVCMITSKKLSATYAVDLNEKIILRGRPLTGTIRPDKLFTANKDNLMPIADLPADLFTTVLSVLQKIFSSPNPSAIPNSCP